MMAQSKLKKTIKKINLLQKQQDKLSVSIEKLWNSHNELLFELIQNKKLFKLTWWNFGNPQSPTIISTKTFYELKHISKIFGNDEDNQNLYISKDELTISTTSDRKYIISFDNVRGLVQFIKHHNIKVNVDKVASEIPVLKEKIMELENIFKMFENDYTMRQILE